VTLPPHPVPLPAGERGRAASSCSSPLGERKAPAAQRREGEGARRVYKFAVPGRADPSAFSTLFLFLLLLCLLPPDGVLSDNEENYFQLGAHFVLAAPISPYTAVVDGAWHRVVNDFLLGGLVHVVGFGAAQIIARALAALAYAAALRALFRRFGLSTIDAILAVGIFALMGQALIGGEWLFNGYEAKVAAYALVLAGLAMVLDGRSYVAALLFAAAIYFHFLVGVFWFFAAVVFTLIAERGQWRRLLPPMLCCGACRLPTRSRRPGNLSLFRRARASCPRRPRAAHARCRRCRVPDQ